MKNGLLASRVWAGRYRWVICLFLFLITICNYVNRQAFSLVAPVVSSEYHLTNFQIATIIDAFLLAYTFGQLFSGSFMDWVGSKKGFTLAALVWSIASILTSLAGGMWSFSFYRFLLGAAESANFPGGVKVVAEWFPPQERSTAVGIFSSGASIGAILTPPLTVYLVLHFGWQIAFIALGIPGLVWVLLWWKMYAPMRIHPQVSEEECLRILAGRQASASEPEVSIPWAFFLRQSVIWGVFVGRFVEEPVSWFYFSWLGVYLKSFRDVPLRSIGLLLIIPFVTLDIGYVAGGWAGSRLMKAGWSLNRARKTVMALSALLMMSCIPAVYASTSLRSILLVSIATCGHGSWGANIFTLPGDIVPHRWVGSVYGFTAFGGGLGSIIFMQVIGKMLDVQKSFNTVFLIAGILPALAAVIFLIVTGTIKEIDQPASADANSNA